LRAQPPAYWRLRQSAGRAPNPPEHRLVCWRILPPADASAKLLVYSSIRRRIGKSADASDSQVTHPSIR
jgi:hypothetical protein